MGEMKIKMRKGLWSPDEDEKLSRCIAMYMNGSWSDIARKAGLQRCGKSCRRRWMNHLRPDLKRGRFTPTEIGRVVELHNALGNRWSEIAGHLVGRTDNDVKNLWNTQIKRQLKLQQMSNDHVASSMDLMSTGLAISAPHVGEQQLDHLNVVISDTSTNPTGCCQLLIASDLQCMDTPTTNINIDMAQENPECLHHKEDMPADIIKLLSKKSSSPKSVFTFPFSCIPVPNGPHEHLHVEQAEPNNGGLIIHDAMSLPTNINIPHALSSSNLSKLALAPRHDELAFTTSPDEHEKQFSTHDAEEVQQGAGRSTTNSCSSSTTTSFSMTMCGSTSANIANDDNMSSSFKSLVPGKTRTLLMPFMQLQPAVQYHDQQQQQHTSLLYKDEEHYEQQHLPKLPTLDERHTTFTRRSRVVVHELQHDSCGVDNYNNVAKTDSDGTSVSSISTSTSSNVEDIYINATGVSCSASWWNALDVDLQVPNFDLSDPECWQPLADMFEL